jgi:murein DD-endopeptidase MepM/ murein hydrolase activator NlpD
MRRFVGDLRQQLAAKIDRTFVTREILIRTDGRVKYLTATPRQQMAAAGLAAAIVVWALVSTLGAGIAGWIAGARGADAEQAVAELERLRTEIVNLEDRFAAASRDFAANQRFALDLVRASRGDALPSLTEPEFAEETPRPEGLAISEMIAAINGDIDRIAVNNMMLSKEVTRVRLETSVAADATARAALARHKYIEELEVARRQLASAHNYARRLRSQVVDLQFRNGALLTSQARKSADNAGLRDQLARLSDSLAAAEAANRRLDTTLEGMGRTAALVVQDRIALRAARDDLLSKVRLLETRLNTVSSTQNSIVEKIAERTRVGVDEIEKTVAMTGLKVDSLLAAAGSVLSGEGGPFISPRGYSPSAEERFVLASIENLDGEVERWERLQLVLRSLPLAAPLDSYALRSGFGTRKDPVTGRKALHEGLDLVNDTGTPVLATAPGKVVYAGWMGDYGRMIEIDHGLGIRTRYAHLKKILVKVGDEVDYRDEIGLLGSSGRSTGPHLHYEVRVDERPYDPINFLEAGKYVFKG